MRHSNCAVETDPFQLMSTLIRETICFVTTGFPFPIIWLLLYINSSGDFFPLFHVFCVLYILFVPSVIHACVLKPKIIGNVHLFG